MLNFYLTCLKQHLRELSLKETNCEVKMKKLFFLILLFI